MTSGSETGIETGRGTQVRSNSLASDASDSVWKANRRIGRPNSDLSLKGADFLFVVQSQAILQLLEPALELVTRGVDVFRFGNELEVFFATQTSVGEDRFEFGKILAVHDDHLVLIELHFQGNIRIQHGNSRAPVVEKHVFEIVERAL